MENLLLRIIRKVDYNRRICLPPQADILGKDFYLELYKDHIRLIPIKED